MNQGMYLTIVTGILYSALCDALGVESADIPDKERKATHRSYAEGERFRREVNYFQRNPELARNAKEHYNYTCQICGFSPSGLFGNGFQSTALECHHLDPV